MSNAADIDRPPAPALRVVPPTGRPGWPRYLLSGDTGTRKSGTAALLSARPELGTMLWYEFGMGEQTADEYGAIPGVNYQIVQHTGRWDDFMGQLEAGWLHAKAEEEAGREPVPGCIDSMTGVDMALKGMGDDRARRKAASKLVEARGDASVPWSADYDANMTSDLWNLIRKRHLAVMRYVLTWPGPFVLIAAERMATVFDARGNPTPQKDWTLEARKDIPRDMTAWFRMHGPDPAECLKLRSVRSSTLVELGDRPTETPDLDLGVVTFDWIGCEAGVSRAARTVVPDADVDMPDEVDHLQPSGPRRGGGQSDGPRRAGRPADTANADEARTNALKGVDLILGATSADAAEANREHSRKSKAAGYDVLPLLDGRDVTLDNLRLTGRNKVFLAKLGAEVANYWAEHGRSPVPAGDDSGGQGDDTAAAADERAA